MPYVVLKPAYSTLCRLNVLKNSARKLDECSLRDVDTHHDTHIEVAHTAIAIDVAADEDAGSEQSPVASARSVSIQVAPVLTKETVSTLF